MKSIVLFFAFAGIVGCKKKDIHPGEFYPGSVNVNADYEPVAIPDGGKEFKINVYIQNDWSGDIYIRKQCAIGTSTGNQYAAVFVIKRVDVIPHQVISTANEVPVTFTQMDSHSILAPEGYKIRPGNVGAGFTAKIKLVKSLVIAAGQYRVALVQVLVSKDAQFLNTYPIPFGSDLSAQTPAARID